MATPAKAGGAWWGVLACSWGGRCENKKCPPPLTPSRHSLCEWGEGNGEAVPKKREAPASRGLPYDRYGCRVSAPPYRSKRLKMRAKSRGSPLSACSTARLHWRTKPAPRPTTQTLAQSAQQLIRKTACLEHDPEKWVPVFGKDHAPAKAHDPAGRRKSFQLYSASVSVSPVRMRTT